MPTYLLLYRTTPLHILLYSISFLLLLFPSLSSSSSKNICSTIRLKTSTSALFVTLVSVHYLKYALNGPCPVSKVTVFGLDPLRTDILRRVIYFSRSLLVFPTIFSWHLLLFLGWSFSSLALFLPSLTSLANRSVNRK